MAALALLAPLATSTAGAQSRGAAALDQMVEGLGTSGRVLLIAAHPDDEDTNLIAWLARGRHVETAYLSLTRGDGGQNLIGNELGEALGVIRTEELLAARRVDGGQQFFTRAFDFGFSKSAEETFEHWPHDTILGDVVRIVRQFRPHVIVAVFSGTPRDGHGHHQASGMLAREAYELAGDSVRFPREEFGTPWTPQKLYRAARFNRAAATLEIPVGEYDPVLGRSFAEIAGESRSQHSSQGFGALERRGPLSTFVAREAERTASGPAMEERSMFDGVDTTWARFRGIAGVAAADAALDSLPAAFADARERLELRRPASVLPSLIRIRALLDRICTSIENGACEVLDFAPGSSPESATASNADLRLSLQIARFRTDSAIRLAAGIALEAETPRAVIPTGAAPAPVVVRIHNRGTDTLLVGQPGMSATDAPSRVLAPGAVQVDTISIRPDSLTQPWWLAQPRRGDLFEEPVWWAETMRRSGAARVQVPVAVRGEGGSATVIARAPVVRRFADPIRGDVSIPIAAAPAITISLDRSAELAPAAREVSRTIRVHLRSADSERREVSVRLTLPAGLTADSSSRTVVVPGGGEAFVNFHLRGSLAPGKHVVRAVAESGGRSYDAGYQLVNYEHIRPQRLYRPATLELEAVELQVPPGLRVAYVNGVGDNVAPMLEQLGIDVVKLDPVAIAATDLSSFDAVVVGPRAYESSDALIAANPILLAYARAGGTLVVQYQQYVVHRAGVVPYPMEIGRPHDRVTIEEAPVRILDADAPLLRWPNAIGQADFEGWVQERSLYMPRSFDERYTPLLEMSDPGEAPSQGALLVAPLGEGQYVYTSLALFRQLPAGVPGAARLMVNLLSAGRGEGDAPEGGR